MTSIDVNYCAEVRKNRQVFLKSIDPHRPDLYRFCRSLTKTPWDAEDLVQETLAKAYAKLGEVWLDGIQNPKSYLFRMASNTWFDQCRRAGVASASDIVSESMPIVQDALEVRDALGKMIAHLPPKERVAVLLKDVFDYSLDEIATIMETTVGAVKSALARGREKMEQLKNQSLSGGVATTAALPSEALLEKLVRAFNDRDMDHVISLFLENASGEVYGTVQEWNRDQIRRGSMAHTIYDSSGKPLPPGAFEGRAVQLLGETLFLIFDKQKQLDDVWRLREEDGSIGGFTSYYFCPDVLAEIAQCLQVKHNTHNYYFFKES